jgi:hypothetical protein
MVIGDMKCVNAAEESYVCCIHMIIQYAADKADHNMLQTHESVIMLQTHEMLHATHDNTICCRQKITTICCRHVL